MYFLCVGFVTFCFWMQVVLTQFKLSHQIEFNLDFSNKIVKFYSRKFLRGFFICSIFYFDRSFQILYFQRKKKRFFLEIFLFSLTFCIKYNKKYVDRYNWLHFLLNLYAVSLNFVFSINFWLIYLFCWKTVLFFF